MGVLETECDMCGLEGKYKCPRCLTRSCSVQCIKEHKKLSGTKTVWHKRLSYSLTKTSTPAACCF